MNQLKFSLENDQRLELRDELTKSKKKQSILLKMIKM